MTRTTAALTSVIAVLATAFTAVPASASVGYESINAITGGDQVRAEPSSTATSDVTSLNAALHEAPSGDSRPTTTGSDYSSLNSIVGGSEPPVSLVEVRESSGFDWGDALVGALVTMALALMAFGSARLIAQRRSTTVGSQA